MSSSALDRSAFRASGLVLLAVLSCSPRPGGDAGLGAADVPEGDAADGATRDAAATDDAATDSAADQPGDAPSADAGPGDSRAFDPQLPPTTGWEAMEAWLAAGYYRRWHCQPEPIAFVMPSSHRPNIRICDNDILHAAGDAGEYPPGSASVKEVFAPDGGRTIVGYAVQIKVRNYDRRDGGADGSAGGGADAGFDAAMDASTATTEAGADASLDEGAAADARSDARSDAPRPPIVEGYAWYWYERVPLTSTIPHDMNGVIVAAFGDDPVAQQRCVRCHANAPRGTPPGNDFVYMRAP